MLIELAQLPPNIAEQIKQVQYGAVVQFANNGQVIADLTKPKLDKPVNSFLSFYINSPFDVADIELPEFNRNPNKFDVNYS